MNGPEVLRIVDAIHRDKNIDKEIVFEGIEQAILSAARKHFGEEQEVIVDINRESGEPSLRCDGEELDPEILGDLLGRVSAQTAKQVMIQKIREAERDALYDEFMELKSQIVSGSVNRAEHGSCTVNLGKVEGFLPRSEQIPGETHRAGERIRAVVMDVRKAGSRVKIILSRSHPDLVRRLFELEIPEVNEHIIEVRSLAREAGYRSKVAVSCYDSKIDCVGACVGVRGSRIKSIVDELAGERIDIVRWNDSLQVLVPNALQPAEVEDVILCPMLGKVIVLVRDDQLSLAIGKKGQNVRLASKLVGWDIHVMTQDRLDEQLNESIEAFSAVPHVNEELAENLVSQGFFTFDDLSVIEPDQLAELSGLSQVECDAIVDYADEESLRLEKEEKAAYEAQRQARLAERTAAEYGGLPAAPRPAEAAAASGPASDGEATDSSAAAETTAAATETEAEAKTEAEGGGAPADETDEVSEPKQHEAAAAPASVAETESAEAETESAETESESAEDAATGEPAAAAVGDVEPSAADDTAAEDDETQTDGAPEAATETAAEADRQGRQSESTTSGGGPAVEA